MAVICAQCGEELMGAVNRCLHVAGGIIRMGQSDIHNVNLVRPRLVVKRNVVNQSSRSIGLDVDLQFQLAHLEALLKFQDDIENIDPEIVAMTRQALGAR